MSNKIFAVVATFCLILMASCNNQSSDRADRATSDMSNFIQAHTDGFILADEAVVVILKQVISEYKPGDELPKDLFEFTPKIQGKAFLADGNRIEFLPEEALENGKSYSVDFNLSVLISVDNNKELSFKFQVIPLNFTVLDGHLDADGEGFSYLGKIQSSDKIDPDKLKSAFNLGSSKGLEFDLTSVSPYVFSYRISGIHKKENPSTISLEWNGKGIGIDQKGVLEIQVPGKNEFVVLGVYTVQGEDQNIRVVFSDELDSSQDLNGLIYLEGNSDLKLQKKGSEVWIYPQGRLEGEWDLIINQTISSKSGNQLKEQETYQLVMSPLPPEVEFIGQGYILPDGNGLLLPFKAVSLKAVDLYVYRIYSNNVQQFLQQNQPQSDYSLRGTLKYVGRPVFRKTIRLDQDASLDLSQWNSFSVDLSNLIDQDPHALYHVELRMRKSLASFLCDGSSANLNQPIEMLPQDFSDEDLMGYRDDQYYYEDLYPEDYSWEERDNPCSASYYVPSRFKYKNVLATNLGILAKSGNQRDFMVVVTDLLSADPVSNASVQFYNFQQQQILATITDPDGMTEVHLTETPYLIEASYNKQKAFLKVDDGSSLSYSNFDVAGENIEDGIKGFIYGERGVWRPGDTLHLSFALFDKSESLPADLPVVLEVFNATDQLVYKRSSSNYLNGLYSFKVPTHPDDPTGNWKAKVRVGGTIFDKTVKVENIRPNRLKMSLDFNREPLLPRDRDQILDFTSSWLHGAPAANMRAEIRVRMADQKTTFTGFDNYIFKNPLKEFWPDEFMIFDDLLDNQGKKSLPVYLDIGPYSPGMLKAVFTSRVYEKGGGFSTDVYSVPFSPYSRYIGIRIPEMDSPQTQLVTDTLHRVEIVSLSPYGNPVSVDYLQAKVYKLGWNWWWSSQQDNLASYIGSQYEKVVYETAFSTRGGKGGFSFKVNYPDWGRYLVHVYDPESGHGTGQTVYIDWPAWANRDGRANPAGATMLTFTADKKEYKPGDKAILSFPSVKDARALVNIESGDKILFSKWYKTDEGETQVELELKEEMAPNVYASISVIQPHDHKGNDLPIRQYGVLRLNVNNPDSKLTPEIKMPEEIRPNSRYSVEVSERKGKPMTYTLAIVDEGLLNLTRFKTPDPWSVFYATEALGMKTWDLYDEVIGAYGGRIESLLSIGGDEGEIQADEKKANRFVPVVTYLGPFELKKNRKSVHEIDMTNYVGEVRAMVVAGNGLAWGSADAAAFVRQPLMTITALPRKLSPKEKVDLPVSVFVMKEGMGTAKVTITTEGPVKCIGEQSVTISADELGEQMVYFPLETTDLTGIGRINVLVQSGEERAEYNTELEVLNPNPYVYHTVNYVLDKNENVTVPIEFYGTPGSNSGSLTVSGLPSFNLEENLQYLINYPYGCLEQITSSVFVQLMLDRLVDLNENQKLEIDNNIRAAIRKMANFQLPSGGFSLWPSVSGANLWAGTYAGHFLLLAEQKGYVIPGLMKDKWLKFQKSRVSGFSGSSDYFGDSDLQQAYRLYTLALANQADLSAMNRLKEKPDLSQQAAWRLAAAYAIAGRNEVSQAILQKQNTSQMGQIKPIESSFGSGLRDQAMMLETMILMNQSSDAFKLAEKLAKQLSSQRWSTQTTAYSMLALAQLSAESGKDNMLKFRLKTLNKEENINTQKSLWQLEVNESESGSELTITNRNEGPVFVEFTAYGQASEYRSSASYKGLNMEFQYTDMDGDAIDPGELIQGTSFYANVWIQNPPQNGSLENLALSQTFPSGWEIISTRYAIDDNDSGESPFTYRDIKDDRVNTFFNLNSGATAFYRVKLNAAYTGQFYLPPIVCEAMYRPEINGVTEGEFVWVLPFRE